MQRLTPSIFSNRRCGFQNNPQAKIAISYFFLVGFKDKILGHILSLSSLLLLILSFFLWCLLPSAFSSLLLVFVVLVVVVDAATWSLLLYFLLGLMSHIVIAFSKSVEVLCFGSSFHTCLAYFSHSFVFYEIGTKVSLDHAKK